MKKQMSLFVWAAAVFGMSNVWAADNNGFSNEKTVSENTYVTYQRYEKTGYAESQNIHNKKISKRSELYKNFKGCGDYDCEKASEEKEPVVINNKTVSRKSNDSVRKYYLAHPFFQPTKGMFGSITDLASNSSSYDITITPLVGNSISDDRASWKASQLSVKEDLSYGVSDNVSLIASARYVSAKYNMDWSLAATEDDENSDSKIDVWGFGAQWRFVDTNEWIGTVAGFYQNNVDIANSYMGDLKVGYKIGNSTIYGLARLWSINFEQNSYGDGITSSTGDSAFIAYDTDVSSAVYTEGGFGLFSVLSRDWTLNLEAVIGNYDWHNQGSLKAAIGWQPNDNFALNLYAKTSIYDSADGKDLGFWMLPAGDTSWSQLGNAEITGYSETSFGVQGILYF